jgi:hypothetical protein
MLWRPGYRAESLGTDRRIVIEGESEGEVTIYTI